MNGLKIPPEIPRVGEGRELYVSASVGISTFPEHGDSADTLQTNAGKALREAKRAGKKRFRLFEPDLSDAVRKRLEISNRLSRAIDRSELQLNFQPQFRFQDGTHCPIRFEALLRWHPLLENGLSPAEFIPVAEETGLIVPIGKWVLTDACERARAWQTGRLRNVGVAVNVSAVQLARPDFAETVALVLEATGLDPHLLELELTESVFIRDFAESERTLVQLKKLGVTIAIDDFGTGYSSLSYLQNLPVDALKIDRNFLRDVETKPSAVAMLTSIVSLAHSLSMRAVLEGVETQAQYDVARDAKCDELQGFLTGRPLTVAEIDFLAGA